MLHQVFIYLIIIFICKMDVYYHEASVHIIFFGDESVHILPYDPQCHELFAIYL